MLENSVLNQPKKKDSSTNSDWNREEVLEDFKICWISREASILARKEVLTGKAKFGITGDGKEVPQVVMARVFKKGDWRSGYYRDQTFMFALDLASVEEYFAQLYADTQNDPWSGGRQMNNHYATESVNPQGEWTEHKSMYNVSAGVSCTAGQMARALGLALASKKYREVDALKETQFSKDGNEICFVTIGDASTSEGVFWETLNAAGVMQVPMAVSVWDDGYGISVPVDYQTTKGSISEALNGMEYDAEKQSGMRIYKAKGWDYPGLRNLYEGAMNEIRAHHIPALFHIDELTQPQGHSTSGSHERYKSKERLQWEKKFDCLVQMEKWMLAIGIADKKELEEIKLQAKKLVKEAKNRAWKAFIDPVKEELNTVLGIYEELPKTNESNQIKRELKLALTPLLSEILQNARRMLYAQSDFSHPAVQRLVNWINETKQTGEDRYETHLYSNSKYAALKVPVVPAKYSDKSKLVNGYELLNTFFKKSFKRDPRLFGFGEDVGFIGDVNQGFAGLQKEYGEARIFDTGIREWTIMGQAIGMAMRGLRPISEIQYLDYLIYGLEPLNDDLSTLRYRSNGLQQAPAIIRTRGHRLEGIWHSGSPISMLLGSLRGMYLLVPRNMTQAAGFYNTMLKSDDPALIIECLNGYRLKERLPDNIGNYTVPLGVPEVLNEGTDITVVTYGSCVRVAQKAVSMLADVGISVELIDVQSLLPFDLEHRILASLKKTNRILFVDEDVPGGATAYMMQEVMEKQGGYKHLDSQPATLTAKAHRPPYGSDGDYFSKPNPEDIFEKVYQILHEASPKKHPHVF